MPSYKGLITEYHETREMKYFTKAYGLYYAEVTRMIGYSIEKWNPYFLSEVEDITQEFWMGVMDYKVKPYKLSDSVRQFVQDFLREQRAQKRGGDQMRIDIEDDDHLDVLLDGEVKDAEYHMGVTQEVNKIKEYINNLKGTKRDIASLILLQQYTQQEAADQLMTPQSNVARYIRDIRKELKDG